MYDRGFTSNLTSLATRLSIPCIAVAAAAAVYLHDMPEARACGCFVQSNPTVPIVQAGERIVFAMENGNVVAHIQIQYSGDPGEFGWLVPLPALPDVQVGTDELFTELIRSTQPSYRVVSEFEGNCPIASAGGEGDSAGGGSAPDAGSSGGPLVFTASIGPYDYAVLQADSKQPMLDWLNENGYFVPAGTENVIDPYIYRDAYFLALKLRSGNDVGDLQPVVVRYASSLPMIPIVLTSVAADPDMGVLVWVLGEHRAIPRNYYHTQINDAAIDWLNNGSNYVNVITRAVDDADGHHSFVTEYAGTSSISAGVLDPEGRFGNREELAAIADAQAYINYLNNSGFTVINSFGQYSSQMLSILQDHLPVPSALLANGIAPNDYYTNISYYLDVLRMEQPELFADLDLEYSPEELTGQLWERIVTPTLEAGRIIRENPYLTRLFTTLSPEEMSKDPVFSFNPSLPEVSNIHTARLVTTCEYDVFSGEQFSSRLITEQGWVLYLPENGGNDWPQANLPASRATEVLREEGPAEVVKDNNRAVSDAIKRFRAAPGSSGGCVAAPGLGGGAAGVGLLALPFAIGLLRRRRSRAAVEGNQ